MSQKALFELASWLRYYLPTSSYVAPFHGAPIGAAKKLLRLGKVSPHDTLVDLGCGDGRLLIHVSQYTHAKCVGYELDPGLVQAAKSNVFKAGLQNVIDIHQMDARQAAVEEATVIFMYLSRDGNLKLYNAMKSKLQPGTRLLTLAFPLVSLKPAIVSTAEGLDLFIYEHPLI